jgi:MYXO-CTERM domain-containing protein
MFKNGFGWYNVTAQKPAASDLHLMQDCNATAGQSVVLDLASEPAYMGGDVGFFLITPESHAHGGTCDSGDCCATVARATSGAGYVYFTQKEYNPDTLGGSPYIHELTYQSHLTMEKFYFAWEDTFATSSADFTDFVTGVSGIQCSGGGVSCDTGKLGVCALGVTACAQGMVTCTQLFQPGPETCNGLDDDCNGKIDDGAVCPGTDVCVNGACVPHCSTNEFPCEGNAVCDSASGLCVDPSCEKVTCPSGQICAAGQCRAPCQGVVCPHGQDCVNDACVDLCKGVACPSGQVCRSGKCFDGCDACDGISCQAPLTCDAQTSDCKDPSCPNGCPAGTFCDAGQCKDDCSGAACPPGQTCTGGACNATGAPGSGGGFSGFGGGGGAVATSTGGGSAGRAGSGGGSGGAGATPAPHSGCSCTTSPAESDVPFAVVAAAIGIAARRRRRGPRI